MNNTLIFPSSLSQLSYQLPILSSQLISTIVLTFDILLLSTLNQVTLKQINIFSWKVQQFVSQVNISLNEEFDYQKMKYQANINVNSTANYLDKIRIQVDRYQYQTIGRQNVRIFYQINQKFRSIIQKYQNNKIKTFFIFGNNQNQLKNGKYAISNIQIKVEEKTNLKRQQIKGIQDKMIINYQNSGVSLPISYHKQQRQSIQKDAQYFKQLLTKLPPYFSSQPIKKTKLFICHDMKGGYKQDTFFNSPINPNRTSSYRFHYFWQSSIFNYFSHHAISIPPRHWRQQCKRYNVKCLGTFIVEKEKVDQRLLISWFILRRSIGLMAI